MQEDFTFAIVGPFYLSAVGSWCALPPRSEGVPVDAGRFLWVDSDEVLLRNVGL